MSIKQAPLSTYYVDHALYARNLAYAGEFDAAFDSLSQAVDLTDEGDDEAMSFIDREYAAVKSIQEYARMTA